MRNAVGDSSQGMACAIEGLWLFKVEEAEEKVVEEVEESQVQANEALRIVVAKIWDTQRNLPT